MGGPRTVVGAIALPTQKARRPAAVHVATERLLTCSTLSTSQRNPRTPDTRLSAAGSFISGVPAYGAGDASGAPPSPQASAAAHIPGPPGTLSPPIWLWQQTSPASQVPSTPAVHGQPIPVQGVGGVGLGSSVGVGPSGWQPTEDGVHVPGAPGAASGSFAQQTSVVSPQGFCVPVEQAQPTPGRAGSVHTGNAVAVGAAAVAVGAGRGVAVGAAAVAVGSGSGRCRRGSGRGWRGGGRGWRSRAVGAAAVGVGPLGGAGQKTA